MKTAEIMKPGRFGQAFFLSMQGKLAAHSLLALGEDRCLIDNDLRSSDVCVVLYLRRH